MKSMDESSKMQSSMIMIRLEAHLKPPAFDIFRYLLKRLDPLTVDSLE